MTDYLPGDIIDLSLYRGRRNAARPKVARTDLLFRFDYKLPSGKHRIHLVLITTMPLAP